MFIVHECHDRAHCVTLFILNKKKEPCSWDDKKCSSPLLSPWFIVGQDMQLPGTSRLRKNRWKMSKVKQCLLTFLNFKFCQNDTFCQAMTIKSKWEKGQFLLTRQQRIIKCSPRQKCSGLKTCFVAEMFAQPPPTPPGGQTPHLLLADNIHPSWRSTSTPPVVSLHPTWQSASLYAPSNVQPPPPTS